MFNKFLLLINWLFKRWSMAQATPSWFPHQHELWGVHSRFLNSNCFMINHRPVTYVWANATDTVSSHIKIYSVQVKPISSIHPFIHPSFQVNQQIALKDLGTIVLSSCVARSIIFVPGTSGGVAQNNSDNPLRCDLVSYQWCHIHYKSSLSSVSLWKNYSRTVYCCK